ncbi:hypothetical protein MKX03_012391 [Papaver bracteatum]|nr:hypothetical protein MKX03_012391 [Papaver bracteatum]
MEDEFNILLPDEIILEFLSRLPMKPVMRFSSVSKYLYNSVHKDANFANSHLINYAQKHPFLVFYNINANYGTKNQPMLYKNLFFIKGADEIQSQSAQRGFLNFGRTITANCTFQLRDAFVGYCNGLICFTRNQTMISYIDVWNFTTDELLRIFPPAIDHGGKKYRILSYGFGFDSFSKEYKLVFVVRMFNTMSLKCWIYRFGTKSSWEEISAPDEGRFPLSDQSSDNRTSFIFREATFTTYGGAGCGGALFWMTRNPRVILVFDLHQHKFQYIQLPFGPGIRNYVRFFEYKGYLVISTLEKKAPAAGSRSGCITTLEKVHLNILKSYKDDQEWVKETVDLSPYRIPFLGQHNRLVSFRDHVLLYWMDPNRFQFFNLHTKCLKVVREIALHTFQKTPLPDLLTHDYRLNCEVENIFSLKTLLPRRAQRCDAATVTSIAEKGLGHIYSLKEPKTVGGMFCSDTKPKASEYFFFDD